MRVSVILTVLNEAASLPGLLDSLLAQTRQADEVIVCDGGSRDSTVATLRAEKRLPLRLIEAPGANISRGRNLAIAAASYEIIACLDAGVRIDPRWLEQITGPFDSGAAWVGGFFLPDPHNTFELAMGATVLPVVQDIDPSAFLPSSRSVAFLKTAWQQVGGYPEWLDYCEDLIFDLKMRAAFGPCVFATDALVHFRPRSSLRAFFRQYYLYARGDGKANLWLKRHLLRYATYLLALPAMLSGMALLPGAPLRLLCVALLALGVVLYTRTPYRRLMAAWQRLPARERIKAACLVPGIRVVGDVAKMVGYPAGVWWRLRRAPIEPVATGTG